MGLLSYPDGEGKAVLTKGNSDSLLSQEGTFEFRVDHVKHESGSTEVEVIDFSKTEVHAKRTSMPTESLYPVKEDEHFEVGGTFEFKLEGPDDYSDLPVAWIVQELDLINETLDSGAGETGSYTFQSGKDVGRVNVQFFVDRNGNEEIDSGECIKESPEFKVLELTEYSLSSSEASTVNTPVSAGYALSVGTELLLKKHAKKDWRSCVNLTSGTHSVYVKSDSKPDEVTSSEDNSKLQDNVDSDFIIVRRITWCNGPAPPGVTIAGCAEQDGKAIIAQAHGTDPRTWTHEFGHTLGLSVEDSSRHDNSDPDITPSKNI